ncbi:MAG: zinc ABC transporter substrate-binding protein [Thermoplasmata archaeon]
MKKLSVAVIAILAVVVVAGSAVAVEAYYSTAPSSPCAALGTTSSGTQPASGASAPATSGTGSARSTSSGTNGHDPADFTGVIQVVAAENFWGSLVSQLGGNHTSVLSIVTDPNADPHEYEANSSDAIAISNAQFVIVNGVGYDDWALQLIAAANTPNQVVLNVGILNGVSVTGNIVTGNPHMWYNPVYVNNTVAAMYSALVSIEPSSTAYFQANYAALNVSLGQLYGQAAEIRNQFAGSVVASTESIFVYLANYTHLDLISPPDFMKAIAEGNDPPAQSVVEFQCQLQSGTVAVLVYNEQTVTPITSQMKVIAAQNNVTVVGVTETIQPPGVTFQVWMESQYLQLENALNAKALGQ